MDPELPIFFYQYQHPKEASYLNFLTLTKAEPSANMSYVDYLERNVVYTKILTRNGIKERQVSRGFRCIHPEPGLFTPKILRRIGGVPLDEHWHSLSHLTHDIL
jgi:hypothetical protein